MAENDAHRYFEGWLGERLWIAEWWPARRRSRRRAMGKAADVAEVRATPGDAPPPVTAGPSTAAEKARANEVRSEFEAPPSAS